MMSNKAAAAEGEYARAKTSVWWDIENCQVPRGCDANGIAQKLSSELMKMNYCGPLTITSYGNTDLIPDSVQQALSSTGISLNHVPSGRKDASDKKILVDMFLWVLDNPAPANLMLISGDGDFSYTLHRLRMMRYNIILAHTPDAPAPLVASANTSWLWRSLLSSGDCPLTLCESETSSGDVSEPPADSGSGSSRGAGSKPDVSEPPVDSGSGSSGGAGSKPKEDCVPEGSSKVLRQKTKRKRPPKMYRSAWFCKLCHVTCPNLETSTTHITSEEHIAQRKLNKDLVSLGEPESLVAAALSECHQKESETTTNMVVEASTHCGSCSMVEKQTEAIQVSVNVEESVKENDLQSRDVQESMECLEKQNKEVMETSTTSETSGREFCIGFKEQLESYSVEPSYVDRVFSEMSGECFDSVLKKPEPSQNNTVIEKLEGMLKQSLEMKSGEPENALAGPTENLEEEETNRMKKKKETEPYVCSLCNVSSHWPHHFETHLNGRKHTSKIKKHIEAMLDEKKIQDIDQPKETREEVLFQPREELENIDCLEKQNKKLKGICAISGKSVEELFQNLQEVLESENKSLLNEECIVTELNPEFSASKEARKQEFSQDANLTRELENMLDRNLESNSAGATLVKKQKSKDEAYVCGMCSVTCHNPIDLESHLMGRKHVARLKRLAEVRSMLHA